MALSISRRFGRPRFDLKCVATPTLRATTPRHFSSVQELVHPQDVRDLIASGDPFVLHFGTSWLRNTAVSDRLADWAGKDGAARHLSVAANSGLGAALVRQLELHLTSLPAVLLFREGRQEKRIFGNDTEAVDRLLKEVDGWQDAAGDDASALRLLTSAEIALHKSSFADAKIFFDRVIAAGPSPHEFRAHLGLLRCAVRSAEAAAPAAPTPEVSEQVASSLWQLLDHHGEELSWMRDSDAIARDVAHAELLVDAWLSDSDGEEKNILQLYASGSVAEAMQAALKWYQRTAVSDIGSLIESYMAPERYVTDRPGTVPSSSIFASVPALRCDLDDAPGPTRPRAMLRRFIAALGPTHELVSAARVDLAFLLDRKPFVPFVTRSTAGKHKGGGPERSRGSGSGNGYSKPFWLYWGPGRDTFNSKKMGGPHSVRLE